MNIEISRRWWFPFAVEVWVEMGPINDWKRGKGTWWLRKGTFLRKGTAERFAAWLRQEAI